MLTAKDLESELENASANEAKIPRDWRVLKWSMLFAAVAWVSFPPIGIWPLAWLAPIPLMFLAMARKLPPWRTYTQLFIGGWAFWLAAIYFIPIPHFLLWFAWLALSAYCALYVVLFVGLSRVLIHRMNLPSVVVLPVVWTGLCWIRSTFLTGFAMVCLSQSQYRQTILIQVSDIFGAYTLEFCMTLFAAGLATIAWPWLSAQFATSRSEEHSGDKRASLIESRRGRLAVGSVACIFALGFVLSYGYFRLNQPIPTAKSDAKLHVALIQGSVDTRLSDTSKLLEQKFTQYVRLTDQARKKWPEIDLIVWPEANYPMADLLPETDLAALPPGSPQESRRMFADYWHIITGFPTSFETPVPVLAGTATVNPVEDYFYNSAVLTDTEGKVVGRYYKNQRVVFGEFLPIIEWFPELARSVGNQGMWEGQRPECFALQGINFAPNVCFESMVPHLLREHMNLLESEGNEPDCMINVTNDGWFFGANCLDLHLASNVLRAVELRKPNLVCANTGFSAEIDAHGRILQQGPRRDTGIYLATVTQHRSDSLYRQIGDTIPMGFGAICVFALAAGWRNRMRKSSDGA